jgi:hypothetical protein
MERQIAKDSDNRFTSNDVPLKFFDFTGFETGEGRLNKAYYAAGSDILNELWSMYEIKVQNLKSKNLECTRCSLDYFSNNQRISNEMRHYYRSRFDIQQSFPNPQIIEQDKSITLSFFNEFKKQHGLIYNKYLKFKKIVELILDRFRN